MKVEGDHFAKLFDFKEGQVSVMYIEIPKEELVLEPYIIRLSTSINGNLNFTELSYHNKSQAKKAFKKWETNMARVYLLAMMNLFETNKNKCSVYVKEVMDIMKF